jgi:WD40-like Beta Propeller Repeat
MRNPSRTCPLAIAAVSLVALTSCAHGRAPSPDATTANTGALPQPLGAGHQQLAAGVHVLDLVSREKPGTGPAHLPRIAITLPAGWFNYDGWAMNDGGDLSVGFWDVDKVYATPCRWQSKPMIDPGRTVDGLGSALTRRPLRNASTPTDVTLGGFHGKYLRWSVPPHIHLAKCDQGYFESWTALGWSTDRWEQGPGQVGRIWILNVHGQRLVVDANYLPSATTEDRAELNRIVHSIRFGRTTSASAVTGVAHESGRGTVRNGEWIAYSTAPAGQQTRRWANYGHPGSDVFIVHAGGQPKLVAGRGSGTIWNVCPAFSPNGRMLAFGRKAPGGQAIIVVGVTRDGTIGAPNVALKVPGSQARCPKWSSDSSRLAYVDRSGKIVVRALDGSTRHRKAGDPTLHDFEGHRRKLASPTGDLVARLSNSGIVVSQPDDSDRRVLRDSPPSYAIGGWSPDGRKLLVMQDVGGGFRMRAVSVDPPFVSTTVVAVVPVNGSRSWPGYGDVSWQPIPRH